VKRLHMSKRTFVADLQPSVVSEPRDRAFDDVPESAQPTAVNGIVGVRGNQRSDSSKSYIVDNLRGSISRIALKDLGSESRPSLRSLNGRNCVKQGYGGKRVIDVGWSYLRHEGDPLGFRYEMALAAGLPSVCWVGTGLGPPKTARKEALSTTARDQSIAPSFPSLLSSRWCTWSQIPSAVHSANLRQHVTPLPQPNWAGSRSHGIPLRSTKMIPAKQSRSATRGLPPLGLGRSLGSNGAISVQSSSGTRQVDMSNPLSRSRVTHRHFAALTLAVLK